MTSKRVSFVMLGLSAILVALAAFVTYTGRNLIIKEGEKLVGLKLENEVLGRRGDALIQAKKDIASYAELEQLARTVVPQDKDQARTVVDIIRMAREAGVTNIAAIEFPQSLLGEIARGSKNSNKTVDPNLTQLTALTSPKGVYSMEIRITGDDEKPIPYRSLVNFLAKLEKNRRTAQVTNIAITPDDEDRRLISFSLTLTTYVKP